MKDKIDWSKGNGLVPAIVQDHRSGRVLMLGFLNQDALEQTIHSGRVTFWSRTKKRLWLKGETSGNFLSVVEIRSDCDNDALLIIAEPDGPTCHREKISCFGEDNQFAALEILGHLQEVIRSRRTTNPENSYTARLFRKGSGEILKKLGEEAVELVVAANQGPRRVVEETADLLYHLLVFLEQNEVSLGQVMQELSSRHTR
jgi:phosphoribosyl-ATP pyrophosphohydrolase/phosphoribosyl-AMP cyclohydrolase